MVRVIDDLRPAAVILMRTSFCFKEEVEGIGRVILVRGLPISVRARAVGVVIVEIEMACIECELG